MNASNACRRALAPPPSTHLYTMHETSRLLDAASALSRLLRAAEVPHAFYGNVYTAVLANAPQANVGP